jgi:hypothetical protein
MAILSNMSGLAGNRVAEWKLDSQVGKWVAKLVVRSLCFVDGRWVFKNKIDG